MDVLGRTLKPVAHKRVCDWDAPGHNRIIPPGKSAVQVGSDYDAAGTYHGGRCYQAALERYRDLKQQVQPEKHEDIHD